MPHPDDSFAVTFMAVRHELDVTRAYLARQSKLALSTISRWENGEREPLRDSLDKFVANVPDLSPAQVSRLYRASGMIRHIPGESLIQMLDIALQDTDYTDVEQTFLLSSWMTAVSLVTAQRELSNV